jgi:excisionase family DNA binding protein
MDHQKECATLTIKTGAERANVSVPTFAAWVKRSDFPAFKSGRRWIIPTADFDRWMSEQAKARAEL